MKPITETSNSDWSQLASQFGMEKGPVLNQNANIVQFYINFIKFIPIEQIYLSAYNTCTLQFKQSEVKDKQ